MSNGTSWFSSYLAGRQRIEEHFFAERSLASFVLRGHKQVALLATSVAALRQEEPDLSEQQCVYLLVALTNLTGQELSCEQLSHVLQVVPQDALRQLVVAERAGVWRRLTCFDPDDESLAAHHKGYMVDTALACLLLQLKTPVEVEAYRKWGALFETWVVDLLAQQLVNEEEEVQMFFWRTGDGVAEVDVVLQRDNWLYPIEIKAADNVERKNAAKIDLFRQRYADEYRIAPGVIIYGGERLYAFDDDVIAMPVADIVPAFR